MIDALLQQLIDAGAVVAWLAVEGNFADPPCLFDSEVSGAGVWAARTRRGDAFEPPELDERFRFITDDELAQLREAAGLGACQSTRFEGF